MDCSTFPDLFAIYAFESGATDSGIHDEERKATLLHQVRALCPNAYREAVGRAVREEFLTDKALHEGYGCEDATDFVQWLEDSIEIQKADEEG